MIRLLFLAFIVATSAFGKGTQITASGGSPIPTAFSTSDSQSKAMECQGNVVEILNLSATALAYGFGKTSSVPVFDYAYALPGSTTVGSGVRVKPLGGMSAGDYVYIRSAGSAITSGTVLVSCFYEAR